MNEHPIELGRFDVECELGRGGMGVVYRAFDPLLDRLVAIKTIRGLDSTSADVRKRFRCEARAIGKLAHPNIVTLYDLTESRGQLNLIMQFIDGETLQARLHRGRIAIVETLTIMEQLLAALQYAHVHGVIHRDVKPANIMITHENMVKLGDFGLAKLAGPSISVKGMVIGTPGYMSPEQILGRAVDGRTDIFSLGCVLYELVTGLKPFIADNPDAICYKIVHQSPSSPKALVPDIDASLEAVLLKALAKDPKDRFSSCSDFEVALKQCHMKAPRPLTARAAPRRFEFRVVCTSVALVAIALMLTPTFRPRSTEVLASTAPTPVASPPHSTQLAEHSPSGLPFCRNSIPRGKRPPLVADDFRSLLRRGDIAFQNNRYNEALDLYSKAYELHPDDR